MSDHSFARAALAAALLPALAAQSPPLLPPILLPGTPTMTPAAEVQQTAAMAVGGSATLLVFEDKRAGDFDLFGVRLDSTGAPIDVVPFPIAKDPGDQTKPKVVWNGRDWLVVYSNQVDPGSGYFAYQVAARRVSPQGVVLDAPIGLAIDDTGGYIAATTDGNNFVVAWAGFSAGTAGISCKRIGPNGAVLDPVAVAIAPSGGSIYFGLGATFVGGNYVFTWHDSGLRGRRYTPTLSAVDAVPVAINANNATFASNGSQLYLVWAAQNAQFLTEVRGQRYGADLRPIDASGVLLAQQVNSDIPSDPAVVFDGTQWIVSWLHNGTQDQRAARVTTAGVVLDRGGVTVPDASPNYLYGQALGALPGGGALLAWHDGRGAASDVFGTTFSAAAVPGVERCYTVGGESLANPRTTAGAGQFLVTFTGATSVGSRVLAQRVDAFGTPLDAQPIEVARASHALLSAGGAAWNGNHYLVTWADGSTGRILAKRLRADGTLLDTTAIDVMPGAGADVAALGDTFLVTGVHFPLYPQNIYTFCARVRGSDGAVLDTPARLVGGFYVTRARVVTLGTQWLVVSESHWSHNQSQTSVLANLVDAQGNPNAGVGVAIANIQDRGSIDVASAGDGALVVFPSGSNWTNSEVLAQRLDAQGNVVGPTMTLTGNDAAGQSRPAAEWTGSEYVVAYQTLQNNVWNYDLEPDVYAVRVSAAGALRDSRGFALWNGEDFEQRPDVASLGSGRALFACARYLDAPHGAFRVELREMWPDGLLPYGIGTAGCAGPQRMFGNSAPTVGNSSFALRCTAVPAAPGLLILGASQDLAGTHYPSLGLRLHLTLSGSDWLTLPMTPDLSGSGITPLPIPGNPALRNANLFVQSIWPWGSTCPLPPLGLSASDGLRVTIR